jgi:hypothetical protein
MSDEFEWHTTLLNFWLALPAAAVAVTVCGMIRWRWRFISVCCITSAVVAACTIALLGASWKTFYGVAVQRSEPGPVTGWRDRTLDFRSAQGKMNLTFELLNDFKPPSADKQAFRVVLWQGQKGTAKWDFTSARALAGKSDLVVTGADFEICLINHSTSPAWICRYGITVPHWFVLLLCIPFPLIWFRRFRRHRYRLRHGLCIKCGYDLRESFDKCPECGTPVKKPEQPEPALEEKPAT